MPAKHRRVSNCGKRLGAHFANGILLKLKTEQHAAEVPRKNFKIYESDLILIYVSSLLGKIIW